MVVLANPGKRSLCSFWANELQSKIKAQNEEIIFHDLYKENFDPVLPPEEMDRGFSFDQLVLEHQKDLKFTDHIVIVHPDWWSSPPAILKGWIDRVFINGVAFSYEGEAFLQKTKIGLLKEKRLTVLITSDSPNSQILETFWKESVGNFTEIKETNVHLLGDIRNKTQNDCINEVKSSIGPILSHSD